MQCLQGERDWQCVLSQASLVLYLWLPAARHRTPPITAVTTAGHSLSQLARSIHISATETLEYFHNSKNMNLSAFCQVPMHNPKDCFLFISFRIILSSWNCQETPWECSAHSLLLRTAVLIMNVTHSLNRFFHSLTIRWSHLYLVSMTTI